MLELLSNNVIFSLPLILSIVLIFISAFGFDILNIDLDMPDNLFIGWLKNGVPVFMLIDIFMFLFGFIGLSLSKYLSNTINIPISLIIALFGIKIFSSFLYKYLPKDESYAISRSSMIGGYGIVLYDSEVDHEVINEAQSSEHGKATEVKYTDKFNNTHYILVKPSGKTPFKKGDKVILISELESGMFIGTISLDNDINQKGA